MSSNYWSSTTNANNTNNAWHVNFNNGNDNNNNKSNNNYVRAVRAGKSELLSFASVHDAYLDCRKRKRGTINALRFEYDLLENLTQLALDVQRGTYRPSRSVCFVTTSPKLREIFAADFRDRVVHHLVVRELEKVWEPRFIHDSYASRKNKGVHAAVERLRNFMNKATRSGKRAAWYLQLDIRSFFMSIDRGILMAVFENGLEAVGEKRRYALLYLLKRIIFHDCTRNYLFRGDPAMLNQVPAHKSLFGVPQGKGLPIGNLTSQFFANVYLNELDQFVKHRLKCRFYIRYVDDFLLLADDPGILEQWRARISEFLADRLSLALKSDGVLKRVSEGSDFLGYIVRPEYRLARRRVVNNLKAKLAVFEKRLVQVVSLSGQQVEKFAMAPAPSRELRQMFCSYLGHFRHADTHNLVISLFAKYCWLNEYFIYHQGRLYDRFRRKGLFRTFRSQVDFFRQRLAAEAVLLVRVGRFYEMYDADAELVGNRFGLKIAQNRRGLAAGCGLPSRLLAVFVKKILALGRDVAVLEEGRPGKYVRERYVSQLYRTRSNHA